MSSIDDLNSQLADKDKGKAGNGDYLRAITGIIPEPIVSLIDNIDIETVRRSSFWSDSVKD